MRTPWSVSVILLVALGATAVVYNRPGSGEPEAGGPRVHAVGVQTQRSPAGTPIFESGSSDALRMAVEVRLPRGRVLGLEPDDSHLATFVDDRGANLLVPGEAPFESRTSLDPSGRFLRFFLRAPELPNASARKAIAEGHLGLRIAERSRVHVAPHERPIEVGTRFRLGPYELELVEVSTLSWNGHASLTFACDEPLDQIGSYRLLTRTGRRVDLIPRALYASDGGWRQTLEGEEPLPSASLAIEVWEDVRTIDVPFHVTARLGL